MKFNNNNDHYVVGTNLTEFEQQLNSKMCKRKDIYMKHFQLNTPDKQLTPGRVILNTRRVKLKYAPWVHGTDFALLVS